MSESVEWLSCEFRGMGGGIGVWVDVDEVDVAEEGFERAREIFERHEGALSRFRGGSELSRLNGRSGEWVVVSDLMWRLVGMGVGLAEETGGLFDVTLLKGVVAAGYDRSFDELGEKATTGGGDVEGLVGRWREIEFDEGRQAVRVPKGVALDLGGIAKGDTAQVVVEALRPLGPVLVDAGGDVVAGDRPRGLAGWPVAIAQPGDGGDEGDLFSLWLANGAVATSGVDYRYWVRNGRKAHHVIDPRTGRPAETDLLTVTVYDGDVATAEAWATAALVAGREVGFELLVERGLAAVMVDQNEHVHVTEPMMGRAVWERG